MKALIDTCVIIDAMQSRQPFNVHAEKIFLSAAGHAFEGYISAKSLADIYYLLHKSTHSDSATRAIFAKLFSVFSISDTTSADCINALSSEMGDFEDAVMAECAAREGMDCIVTRNLSDYKNSKIHAISPEIFLEKLVSSY